MTNLIEIWKPIKGYEGLYEISNLGRVKSLYNAIKMRHRGNILTPAECSIRNGKGYKSVSLYKKQTLTQILVHRLVAQAFIPNPFNLPEVNHKDTDKHNNTSSNLEWVTGHQNRIHGSLNNLTAKGERNGTSKFTNEQILEMRYLSYIGLAPRFISKEFGVNKNYLHAILQRKVWTHI